MMSTDLLTQSINLTSHDTFRFGIHTFSDTDSYSNHVLANANLMRCPMVHAMLATTTGPRTKISSKTLMRTVVLSTRKFSPGCTRTWFMFSIYTRIPNQSVSGSPHNRVVILLFEPIQKWARFHELPKRISNARLCLTSERRFAKVPNSLGLRFLHSPFLPFPR